MTRLRVAALLGLCALTGSAATTEREAGACSCIGPEMSLVAPDRVDDVPLNARIRVDAPTPRNTNAAVTSKLVLRVHGTSSAVSTTLRAFTPGGPLAIAELVPSSPLAPATQYEVAILEPGKVPETTVVGTFRTGKASDTTPPRIDAVGAATVSKAQNGGGGSCQTPGPWVMIEGIHAEDPGRPEAQLVFGVWLGDAAGTIDTKKAPTALVQLHTGILYVGRVSICDAHDFPIPQKAPFMWLGIAAIDEAGNTSPVRRMRIDLAGARPR